MSFSNNFQNTSTDPSPPSPGLEPRFSNCSLPSHKTAKPHIWKVSPSFASSRSMKHWKGLSSQITFGHWFPCSSTAVYVILLVNTPQMITFSGQTSSTTGGCEKNTSVIMSSEASAGGTSCVLNSTAT
jgi:hypothetical protein